MRLICFLCLVLGYGFGLIQTAYIYSNARNINIKEEGSGNAGTTNMIRVMGWKAGLVTLLGDIAKLVVAILFTKWVFLSFLHLNIDAITLALYTGFGVILGHNFPFYLHFNGGKGFAASAALIVCLWDWKLILICAVIFFAVFLLSKYVSLASMLTMVGFAVAFIIFSFTGLIKLSDRWRPDSIILVVLITALCLFQHRTNISRLLNRTESKFSFSKNQKDAQAAGEIVQEQVRVNKEERKDYKEEKRVAKAEYKKIKREAKEEYRQIRIYKPTKYRKQKLQQLQELVRDKNQQKEG